MDNQEINQETFHSLQPQHARELMRGYYLELEENLKDILGDLHDDIIPDSVIHLAADLVSVTLNILCDDELLGPRLIKHEPTSALGYYERRQLKLIYRERQVIDLCNNICYFSSGDLALNQLVSCALPNIRKVYDLSKRLTGGLKNPGPDDSTARINPLTGLVLSMTILYKQYCSVTPLNDTQIQSISYAITVISSRLRRSQDQNAPCVIALRELEENLRSLLVQHDDFTSDDSAEISAYDTQSVRSTDSRQSDINIRAQPRSYRDYFNSNVTDLSTVNSVTHLVSLRGLYRSENSRFTDLYLKSQFTTATFRTPPFFIPVAVLSDLMPSNAFTILMLLGSLLSLSLCDAHVSFRNLYTFIINRSLYPRAQPSSRLNDSVSLLDRAYYLINVPLSIICVPMIILSSLIVDLVSLLIMSCYEFFALIFLVTVPCVYIYEQIDSLIFGDGKGNTPAVAYLEVMRSLTGYLYFNIQVNFHITINLVLRLFTTLERPLLSVLGVFSPQLAASAMTHSPHSSVNFHDIKNIFAKDTFDHDVTLSDRLTRWTPLPFTSIEKAIHLS